MSTNSDRLRRITYKSPYGPGILIWDGDVLVAHELPGSAAAETTSVPDLDEASSLAVSTTHPPAAEAARTGAEKKLVRRLEAYFSGEKTGFNIAAIPLDRTSWTPFQDSVAEALAAVPHGTIVTYSELATAAGHPRACRAVGNCMAANPYPVIIPCHRVIKSGGSLGSFSAGIEWKARLLGLEGLPFPGMG